MAAVKSIDVLSTDIVVTHFIVNEFPALMLTMFLLTLRDGFPSVVDFVKCPLTPLKVVVDTPSPLKEIRVLSTYHCAVALARLYAEPVASCAENAWKTLCFPGFLFVRAQKGICRDGNRVGACLFISGDGNGKQSAGRTA